jgi:hypothetical protein
LMAYTLTNCTDKVFATRTFLRIFPFARTLTPVFPVSPKAKLFHAHAVNLAYVSRLPSTERMKLSSRASV